MLGDKGDTPLLLNKSPATGDVGVIVDHTGDTKRDIQASSNATSLRSAPHSLYRDERWFTGKAPYAGICPGVNDSGIISSLPLPNLATSGQPELLQYFDNTWTDRKSTRLNSSHVAISYAVFCLKKKKVQNI